MSVAVSFVARPPVDRSSTEITYLGGWSADWCGSLRAYMTVLVVVIALPAVPYSTVPFIDYRSIPISRTGSPRVMWLASLASGSQIHRVGPAVRSVYAACLPRCEVRYGESLVGATFDNFS